MASWEVSDPNLELEGSSLGRGSGFYDAQERRRYEVETVELGCWHVEDSGPRELPKGWSGQVTKTNYGGFFDKFVFIFLGEMIDFEKGGVLSSFSIVHFFSGQIFCRYKDTFFSKRRYEKTFLTNKSNGSKLFRF